VAAGHQGSEANSVDDETWYRDNRIASLRFANSLSGGVGLLHMQTAFSGSPGTFRTSFTSGYFSGSQFLCPNEGSCTVPTGASPTDEAESVTSDIAVSATLLSYLEAYAAIHSMATSNTLGRPQLLQVVGDTSFGLKAFSPAKPDRIFAFGGSMDLWLLNGSGMLGVDNANFTLRALAGIDLNQRRDPSRRVPVRLHAMLGYLVDGSGGLVENVEKSRGQDRISRIERFGLDINRVDSLLLGVGAEYTHKTVQPFLEWTFDIPNNRQGYKCAADGGGRALGDSCLKLDSGFASTPSRLTVGTRITPGLRGFSGLLAFDIGTGATSTFIEEVSPEVPWKLYFGLAFAHDITGTTAAAPVTKTQTIERVVELPPPPERHIVGLVIDERTQQPIPNAVIKYQGQNLTGMVSRADGSFETGNLQSGTYSFAITAEGYREGTCQVSVAPPPATAAPSTGAAGELGTQPASSAPNLAGEPAGNVTGARTDATNNPASVSAGPLVTNVACPLKALPAVGSIQGVLLDAETNAPLPGARLTVRDPKGRELSLDADGSGAFRFENVPAGTVRISVEATGYMPQTTDVEVRARAEQRPAISLNKRPKKANVQVTAKELKLSKPVNFAPDTATISADSQPIVQEIALSLKEHPELTRVEIQGHTDNAGTPAYNKRLSQERAEAVRNALVSLGVETTRLTAVGYGQDKPIGPNTSDEGKARNRRVQILVLERK
jgi:outer membrane protein OmpA-like peptidoglycan-associated protein